jgi:hypothetical protein
VLNHAGGKLITVFCRKPKVFGASAQRLRWIDGAVVSVVARAEARNRRWHINHQPEVAEGLAPK